jgi:hypothetical protein
MSKTQALHTFLAAHVDKAALNVHLAKATRDIAARRDRNLYVIS